MTKDWRPGRKNLSGERGESPVVKATLPEDLMDDFDAEARSRRLTYSALMRSILTERYSAPVGEPSGDADPEGAAAVHGDPALAHREGDA